MQDPKLQSNVTKTKNFFYKWFENPQLYRINDSRVKNSLGFRIYATDMRKQNTLLEMRNKIKGVFTVSDTLYSNLARFGFQWLEAFSCYFETPRNAGFKISRSFPSIFMGGLLSSSSILLSSHFAANLSYAKDGINLLEFWILSQLFQIGLSPLQGLSIQLMNKNPVGLFSIATAISKQRLLFNSVFTLGIGLNNSQDPIFRFLYYPTILLSAILLRAQFTLNETFQMIVRTGNVVGKEQGGLKKLVDKMDFRGSWVAIAAFCFLNFAFPIVLPQAVGKDKMEKHYFEYLRSSEDFESERSYE